MYSMHSDPILCIKETCIQLFQSSVHILKFVPVFTDPGSES